ncbi:MAG: endolytic transglycosylase MltG [Desulfuromonadales bacterium]|nr:endolytic transglycosylase MltG [Desulfuromonadales bacterium]
MKRPLLWVLRTIVVGLAVAAVVCGLLASRFLQTPVAPSGEQQVRIAAGTPLLRIAAQLERHGIVSNGRGFVLLARWQGLAGQVQAGEYLFVEPARPAEVLHRLVSGDVRMVRYTFPEGLSLKETAARIATAGLASESEVMELLNDTELARRYQIPATSLEGYLFPETYTLRSDSNAAELVTAMLEQSRRHLTPELLTAAAARGLDRHQLVILASIIQKEAGHDAEMPLIAAVFHNRLRRGMPLQADPTVIYGIADFDGNLTRKHLATPTPYNTYQMRGLPAGPIASPGSIALHATAHPAETDALYFVSRGDGSHVFSKTLSEHNRAVRRYQLGR